MHIHHDGGVYTLYLEVKNYEYVLHSHYGHIHYDCELTNAHMAVLSQCIAIPTITIIVANLVVTDVVTTAVVSVTLIDIYIEAKFNNYYKQSNLLLEYYQCSFSH